MKAVILAAGLGTRMAPFTKKLPKSMTKILNRPLLEYKLIALPKSVTKVIIVINYKGEEIKNYFGNSYRGKKIQYVKDETMSGTAHALWYAKKFLKGRFLVMMGDDIYSKKAMKQCSKCDWSIVCKPALQKERYSMIILGKNKNLIDFVTADTFYKNSKKIGLMFTGLYSMTDEIFKYQPVKLQTKEEWGLPQTLLQIAKDKKIKIIKDDFWIPISTPEDLRKAEKELGKIKGFF